MFRAREAFRRREVPAVHLSPGLLLDEEEFRVEGTVLDHGIPCLAFAFEEKLRVKVWSEGLRRLGLPVGPWLREAKRAVTRAKDRLRDDLAYDEQNVEKVVALARYADQLFIEAPFLDVDADIAAERWHLTARQSGNIAKRARVSRLIPFHFSARYRDRADELTREAEEAFPNGGAAAGLFSSLKPTMIGHRWAFLERGI